MKQQIEKAQQINEVEARASSVRDGSGVNEARTGAKSDASLTRTGSGDVHGGSVYFIRAGDTIKIGFSTAPLGRLRTLQTSHSERLQILGTIHGTKEFEARLHYRFRNLHVRGEWFRADEELLRFINYAKVSKRKTAVPKMATEAQKLRSLAAKHGHSTPIGTRYFMLAQMIENLPTYRRPSWATHEMQTLPYKIAQMGAKIVELMAAAN